MTSKLLRKISSILSVALLAASSSLILTSVAAAATDKGAKVVRETVLGTDLSDDWGGDLALESIGKALGQDLIKALIRQPDQETLDFIIQVAELSSASSPQWAIGDYTWQFTLIGEKEEGVFYRLARIDEALLGADTGEPSFQFQRCQFQPRGVLLLTIDLRVCESEAIDYYVEPELGRIVMTVPRDYLGGQKITGINSGARILASPDGGEGATLNGSGTPKDEMLTDKAYVFTPTGRR